MEIPEIIKALRRNMVETGSLICVGCGREHNCSTHGCAIMREAANMLELLNRRAAPENPLAEDQQKADELIRLLIKGEDVNLCEWCRHPDKGGEKCKGCYLYEDTDEFPSKFTAFSDIPENKPLTPDSTSD